MGLLGQIGRNHKISQNCLFQFSASRILMLCLLVTEFISLELFDCHVILIHYHYKVTLTVILDFIFPDIFGTTQANYGYFLYSVFFPVSYY